MMTRKNDAIILFGIDLDTEGLRAFLKRGLSRFKKGTAILELHQENSLRRVADLPKSWDKDENILAARFFNGEHQLKLRRIDDDTFRLVADFQVTGWAPVSRQLQYGSKRHYLLWGTRNVDLGERLYEERIPRLFDYPGARNLKDRERMAIQVRLFVDAEGRVVWDRFETLVPGNHRTGDLQQDPVVGLSPREWLNNVIHRIKDLFHGRF